MVVAAAALALFLDAGAAAAQQPAPSPTTAASPASAAAPQTDADVIRNGQGSLVFVEGQHGAGSGFVCAVGTQKFLFTNAHVMAGNIPVTLTLLDGSPIRVGPAAAAVEHDMVRFVVAATQPSFNLLEHTGENLLVGDEVLVLGNAKGARVITPIAGKVVGLGPNLVEVDAPFQPGNSGSPIIQKKTGRVVGIATYATDDSNDLENTPKPSQDSGSKRAATPSDSPPPTRKLRRFGYRLDSVKNWQDIAWPEFQSEAAGLEQVDERTDDILALIHDVSEHKGIVRPGQHHTPPVERLVHSFLEATSSRPSPTDALRARQDLLDGLRRVCQSDLMEVRPKLRYDYFAREATERQRFRDEMARMFENAFKAQSNTTGR